MNERIEELLQEAHRQTKGGIYSGHPSEWTEKFAELIIKECAEICNRQANHYAETNNLGSAASAADALRLIIKMHFGIE